MDYYWWFIIGFVLLIVEIITPGFVIMWFGIGAFIAGILDLAGLNNLLFQVIIFSVSSIIFVTLSRTFFRNVFVHSPGNKLKSQVESLVGKTGVVTTEINNDISQGRVLVEGQDWSAQTNGNEILPTGNKVIITKYQSAKLFVDKA